MKKEDNVMMLSPRDIDEFIANIVKRIDYNFTTKYANIVEDTLKEILNNLENIVKQNNKMILSEISNINGSYIIDKFEKKMDSEFIKVHKQLSNLNEKIKEVKI